MEIMMSEKRRLSEKGSGSRLFYVDEGNAGCLYDPGYKKLTRILHSGGNRFYTGSVFF